MKTRNITIQLNNVPELLIDKIVEFTQMYFVANGRVPPGALPEKIEIDVEKVPVDKPVFDILIGATFLASY